MSQSCTTSLDLTQPLRTEIQSRDRAVPRVGAWRYLLLSAVVLAPCFWQSRIQASDLSSHVYNAWLAQLIARGEAPGLAIQAQRTNVLFDLLLSEFWKSLGPAVAQRIAVSLSVLVFFWGAFVFASVVARKRIWLVTPLLAALAYGWVFHVGFFNFYLSAGLCMWVLALLWRFSLPRAAAAIPLLGLAVLAHALPVAWAAGVLAYVWMARRIRPRRRLILLAISLGAIATLRWFLTTRYPTLWLPSQTRYASGTDQLWVFGDKYRVLQLAPLLLWTLLFARLLQRRWKQTLLSIPFQLYVLSAAAVVLIPTRIELPGYLHALVYIGERMSLCVAVLAWALLGGGLRRWHGAALAAAAVVFFAFSFADERALNGVEDQVEAAVAQLPPGQRVVSGISGWSGRLDPLAHVVDRACVGRCFSYANYEPSTGQFRIRSAKGNSIVVTDYGDSFALQTGRYVVREQDLPLYGVYPAPQGGVIVRSLQAHERLQVTRWSRP